MRGLLFTLALGVMFACEEEGKKVERKRRNINRQNKCCSYPRREGCLRHSTYSFFFLLTLLATLLQPLTFEGNGYSVGDGGSCIVVSRTATILSNFFDDFNTTLSGNWCECSVDQLFPFFGLQPLFLLSCKKLGKKAAQKLVCFLSTIPFVGTSRFYPFCVPSLLHLREHV